MRGIRFIYKSSVWYSVVVEREREQYHEGIISHSFVDPQFVMVLPPSAMMMLSYKDFILIMLWLRVVVDHIRLILVIVRQIRVALCNIRNHR